MEAVMICETLRALGVGRHYMGYNMTVQAVRTVMLEERCLYYLKQEIFVPMAISKGCDWRTIERDIRTVIRRAWSVNPERLQEIAGYPLLKTPTVKEFLEIISTHVKLCMAGRARPGGHSNGTKRKK